MSPNHLTAILPSFQFSYPLILLQFPLFSFHESCPSCFKPLQGGNRICKSCRQKIGHCFLCQRKYIHVELFPILNLLCFNPLSLPNPEFEIALPKEPVKGVFVWCPGCGHGGHLEHALEWFGGIDNRLREMCPTGCGHHCNNLAKMLCQDAK
jgi:hypothetical protein